MTAVAVVKTGRPTAAGIRHPSGRIKRQRVESMSPTLFHRIINDGIRLGGDPNLGSQLTRLFAKGEITRSQAAAGLHYADLCGRYDRLHPQGRRSVASPSYMVGFRGDPDVADERLTDEIRDTITKRDKDVFDRYKKIRDDVLPAGPWGDLLERLVCEDEIANPANYDEIRWMLNELAEHFAQRDWKAKDRTSNKRKPRRILREIPFSRFPEAASASQAKAATTMAPTSPKRTETWLRVAVAKLRPDLDGEEIEFAARTMQTLRDRERLRAEKAGK